MSGSARTAHPDASRRGLQAAWRANGTVWLVLLAIMAGETVVAYLPLGSWCFPIDVAASAAAAMIVGIVSMGLDRAPTLDRLAAAAGFLFVLVMFTITACDIYTRI